MTIIDPQDDFGPSTAERLTREFGDGVNATPLPDIFDERMGIIDMPKPDKNDMQGQQARAERILADFAATVNEATGLPAIETPGYVIVPAADDQQARADLYNRPDAQLTPEMLDAVGFSVESIPIEAQATLAAGLRDFLRLADGELEVRLAPLMREIDTARAAHAEATKDKREAVAAIEARIRAHVVEEKESLRGPYFLCSYVKPYKLVSWETDKLEGFASALDDKLKAALLAFKKETDVAASTKWKNK